MGANKIYALLYSATNHRSGLP